MKYSFSQIIKNGVLAVEAFAEKEQFITKLWVRMHTLEDCINAELCSDTDLFVEVDEVPVLLINFDEQHLQIRPIGKEEETLQDWYEMWCDDDRFHQILGSLFMELVFTGDVTSFKLEPPDL